MGFEFLATIKRFLTCSAERAPAIHPRVLHPLKPDVARLDGEGFGYRVGAVRVLRTIHTSPRQQAGEMGDADPEHLLRQNMIDARLKVGNFGRQSKVEAARDLPQEHARLCEWIKEPN